MPDETRQLLVAIVKGPGRAARIMEGFLESGVRGAIRKAVSDGRGHYVVGN